MAAVSPARRCAYAVVRRVFEQGAYADRAFHAEARGLSPRDRALAMALAFGTVQRRATLDHLVHGLSGRATAKLEPAVLAALRLGLMQLLLLDGIAEHAAVHESVELVKRESPGGARLVNAVLRRATREGSGIIARLDDATPEHAAIMHSVPVWLAELWWRELGPVQARHQLAAINRPAESALRVNTLVATPEAVIAELSAAAHPAPGLPEGLVLDAPFDAHASELWRAGAIMPQSRGSMTVGRALSPRRGERVLDLCAAPGAKTTHLAAMMGDEGALRAVERHPGRAAALARNLRRMRVERATVEVADASVPASGPAYDRVLVDPPCSGLGTLQSRPDLRWRTGPARIAELEQVQARILRVGARATASGGTLVYSVCTISLAEGEHVIDRFLSESPDFGAEAMEGADGHYLQLSPARDGTDGFFVARLRRA